MSKGKLYILTTTVVEVGYTDFDTKKVFKTFAEIVSGLGIKDSDEILFGATKSRPAKFVSGKELRKAIQ